MKRYALTIPPAAIYMLLIATTIPLLSLRSCHPSPVSPRVVVFNEAEKRAIDVTLEMTKLVISLATLVFGSVGAIVFVKGEDVLVQAWGEAILIVLTLFFAALSLYFSYLIYDRLAEMLSNGLLDLKGPFLAGPRVGQVYSLIASVISLGFVVIRLISRPVVEEEDDED